MNILISNDDGYDSAGLLALFHCLEEMGHDVTAVAPSRERSTAGHSLTLHKPLRVHEVGRKIFAVSGSPADCVYMGMRHILKKKPDLCVTGINRGANLGADIFYSGTMAAAREAYLYDIPSIATSLCYGFPTSEDNGKEFIWETATHGIQILLEELIAKDLISGHHLLNINVPNIPKKQCKGLMLTTQGRRLYSEQITTQFDPRGKPYYWIGGGPVGYEPTKGSDCAAVADGYISVTPMKVDTTHEALKQQMESTLKLKW